MKKSAGLFIGDTQRRSVSATVLVGLPSWLVGGVLLGVAGSVLVAVAFLTANRLFPGRERDPDSGHRGSRRSGESRRRREVREYLDAIDEPYAEDHPIEGQAVAFYLTRRDVAVTFDPRAYYGVDRSVAHSVLVEHEMPGAMLGERLPFETPDLEPEADEPTAPKAAFVELGVTPGATLDEVNRAYRRRVKEVHPDQGGDEESFRRVREAYATAKQHAAD
jgi:hypothetical protein